MTERASPSHRVGPAALAGLATLGGWAVVLAFPAFMAFVLEIQSWAQAGWALYFFLVPLAVVGGAVGLAGTVLAALLPSPRARWISGAVTTALQVAVTIGLVAVLSTM
jgi:hypothetical protein